MWQRFFGPMAKIVGMDIDPKCKAHEVAGTFVPIGDQSDEKFLQSLIDEFGVPDVVLDDGSHHMDHIAKSFHFLYPTLRPHRGARKGDVWRKEAIRAGHKPLFGR
jgi:hypothetical protein